MKIPLLIWAAFGAFALGHADIHADVKLSDILKFLHGENEEIPASVRSNFIANWDHWKHPPQHIEDIFFKTADETYLKKEQQVLKLLFHINQPTTFPEFIDIANKFSPFDHTDSYNKSAVVETFFQLYRYDLLPKDAIFSVFNPVHLKQAIALFKLFYFAKDYDVFYKTAAWARQNINAGMFVYAFSVAVVHRWDTKFIMLPPIYEISPNLFFSSEIIRKAQELKQTHKCKKPLKDVTEFEGYTIYANYSGHALNLHPEQQAMSYYFEDVDIQSFFYYLHIHFPFWMNSEEYGWDTFNRGKIMYYAHQQSLARYNLELVSNGKSDVNYINWDLPIETPYQPSLVYPNGLEFPSRPKFANLHEYFYNYGQRWDSSIFGYSYTFINNIEKRICDAADSGYVLSKSGKWLKIENEEGFNILGNLIEGNYDSVNLKYYGPIWSYARHLLGYSTQPLNDYEVAPSALEHFETQARDPVFYQLIKKLLVLPVQTYLQRIPPYTEKELKFPGVKITNAEVDALFTFNSYFDYSLINSVFYNPNEQHGDFAVRVRQSYLNHAPFGFKLFVKSETSQKAAIKVFLGPKSDAFGRNISIARNRLNFVQIDHFTVHLNSGENIVTRASYENMFFIPEKTSFFDLYKKTSAALKGKGEFKIYLKQNYIGYPQRVILPKGSSGGTPYQFYFFLYPFKQYQGHENLRLISVDGYPYGYPLDRFIEFEKMFEQIPNFYAKNVKIYFKGDEE